MVSSKRVERGHQVLGFVYGCLSNYWQTTWCSVIPLPVEGLTNLFWPYFKEGKAEIFYIFFPLTRVLLFTSNLFI